MANWSDHYYVILQLIIDEFSAFEDIVRFGAVCRSWQSVSVEKRQLLFNNNSIVCPWLMLAEKEGDDSRGFYSLSTEKFYQINLPEARGRRCWSSKGWLITVGLDLEIHLLNPFSRVRIPLPSQPTFPRQYLPESTVTPEQIRQVFIEKVVLSSRPSLSDDDNEKCVVMAICSQFRKLAFMRVGDEVWKAIESETGFNDVIFFNGQFYAIDDEGRLFICDISSPQPKVIKFAEPKEDIDTHVDHNFYLVASEGKLFMVYREFLYLNYSLLGEPDDDEHYQTVGFDVYKFNFGNRKWRLVEKIGNRALFVGNNSSFAIFPSDQNLGCKPNCIYFTDSYHENLYEGAGTDLGIYWMETEELNPHDCVGPDFFSNFCTPLWVSPSL